MKQADIKRLEKAVELYKKIEAVLDKAGNEIDEEDITQGNDGPSGGDGEGGSSQGDGSGSGDGGLE
jgi:hypothetical protein